MADEVALANRLESLINLPSYAETVGAWITEVYSDALSEMAEAKTHDDLFRAQGKFQAAYFIITRIRETLEAGDAAKGVNEK